MRQSSKKSQKVVEMKDKQKEHTQNWIKKKAK